MRVLVRSLVLLILVMPAIGIPSQPALAAGRCASTAGAVEQRVAAFWQCVGSLGPSDALIAEDLGQWARNVIERAPGAAIRVVDFRSSTALMQDALERASAGIPSAPPKSADVESRIATFWQKVNALGPCDSITATDLGQWALNVIDRDPSKRIRVDDFRASTAGMQSGLDRATAACSRPIAPVPAGPCRGIAFDPARTGIDGYLTWNLQPVAGVEVYAVAGYSTAKVATSTTDRDGYWKLTGFTNIDRPYTLYHGGLETYGSSGYTFNEYDYDPSKLCANNIVSLDTGSGVQERYDSLSLRKYIEGVTLRSGSATLTWDPRNYGLAPSAQVAAGSLAVSWQPLAGAQQYCIKLIDSTGGGWVYGAETCLSGTSHTFSGLASGKSFSVHLLAWGSSRKQHDMIGNELVAFTVK